MIELRVEAMLRRISLPSCFASCTIYRKLSLEVFYQRNSIPWKYLFTNRISAVNPFTSGSFLNKIDCKEKKLIQFSKK